MDVKYLIILYVSCNVLELISWGFKKIVLHKLKNAKIKELIIQKAYLFYGVSDLSAHILVSVPGFLICTTYVLNYFGIYSKDIFEKML